MLCSRPSHLRQTAAVFFSICLTAACGSSGASEETLAAPGVDNFHKIDDHVYRGGQPTEEGFHSLAKLGIKVVVDLRESDSRSIAEQAMVTADGMRYVNVPMKGMHRPSDASMSQALNLLEDTSVGPVFVHCKRGADRTGDVIACYRVEHDHWKNAQALAEARSLGMSWFQKAIQHYVLAYSPRVIGAAPSALASAAGPAPETAARSTPGTAVSPANLKIPVAAHP